MPIHQPFVPQGVMPACLLPFDAEMAVDENAFRNHLRDLVSVDGITGIAINGHAAEIHALTFKEQMRALTIAKEELQDRVATIAGIYTESSLDAAQLASHAHSGGADCLLVFPPSLLASGGDLRPEMIHEHLRRITGASDLPIILFQFPEESRLAYPLSTLLNLCEEFPQIRAVKDMIGNGNRHEQQIRELKSLDNPVKTVTTHSSWLLGSLAMGAEGILSGAGSVIADLQVSLFNAVQADDLKAARMINDRIYPTVRAFYDAPLVDMHNRMKEALVSLGKMKEAHVRPPLMKLSDAEIDKIRSLMERAGLSNSTVYKNNNYRLEVGQA